MTVQLDGSDIGAIVEGAIWGGSVVGVLILALIVYLLVRPPRHVRERRRAERSGLGAPRLSEADAEDLRRTMDRMEARLEVLERAMDENRPALSRRDEEFEEISPAADGRQERRKD